MIRHAGHQGIRGAEPSVTAAHAPCCPHHRGDGGGGGAGTALTPAVAPTAWWSRLYRYLRQWSGDDAYERYLASHHGHGHILLSRREFYRRYLERRAGGSRCC
jgi:uncharacterized short protein YbdD (DUF466 family)